MSAGPLKILIVVARFYPEIADHMIAGAKAALTAAEADFDVVEVPGAFEIPAVIAMAADTSPVAPPYDGFIALGCVIRGETTHYDYVCTETARAIMDLSVQRRLAIGYGILTCENGEQAYARADPARKNKGKDAVEACLSVIRHRTTFKGTWQ
jgi:6,7-dimethyl-8-ribityllumazine synthase